MHRVRLHMLLLPTFLPQDAMTKQYADLIPGLADLARNLVRDLDPQVGSRHTLAVGGCAGASHTTGVGGRCRCTSMHPLLGCIPCAHVHPLAYSPTWNLLLSSWPLDSHALTHTYQMPKDSDVPALLPSPVSHTAQAILCSLPPPPSPLTLSH